MNQSREQPQNDAARAMVRRLRDGLARELAGLNEDAPRKALRYAAERIAAVLAEIKAVLEEIGTEEVAS